MRKPLLAALAAFVVAAGAFARDYKIGDTGPGGGTVFLIEDGEVYEVSGIGGGTWLGAKSLCSNYRGGGYDDWRLPTIDELVAVYKNLDVDEIGDIKSDSPGAIYWSAAFNGGSYALAVSFYNGFVGPLHFNTGLLVMAVRSF